MDKLEQIIGSIRGLEIPMDPGDDLTLTRLADKVAILADWNAQAFEEIRQLLPR